MRVPRVLYHTTYTFPSFLPILWSDSSSSSLSHFLWYGRSGAWAGQCTHCTKFLVPAATYSIAGHFRGSRQTWRFRRENFRGFIYTVDHVIWIACTCNVHWENSRMRLDLQKSWKFPTMWYIMYSQVHVRVYATSQIHNLQSCTPLAYWCSHNMYRVFNSHKMGV